MGARAAAQKNPSRLQGCGYGPAVSGETRRYRVPVAEIAYVRAIYEAYDGLGMLTAPAPDRGELELWVGPGLEAWADEVEARLVRECGLQRL